MPNDRTRLSIKRIIALPGDRVSIDGRTVSVNGVALSSASPADARPSAGPSAGSAGQIEIPERTATGREWVVQWDPARFAPARVDLTVPPGEVFVLGDNRSNSLDSRQLGTVSMEDVVGRARRIWFSWGPDGVRWERIGQRAE
jgi:signal peptidase I